MDCVRERERGVRSKEWRLGSWDLLSDILWQGGTIAGFFHKGFVGFGLEHSLCLEHWQLYAFDGRGRTMDEGNVH